MMLFIWPLALMFLCFLCLYLLLGLFFVCVQGLKKTYDVLAAKLLQSLPSATAQKLIQVMERAGYDEVKTARLLMHVSTSSSFFLIWCMVPLPTQLNMPIFYGLALVWLWSLAPLLQAKRLSAQRQQHAVWALPGVMDGLAMLLATGTPLVVALQKLLEKSPTNTLHEELKKVIQQVRTGMTFTQALEQLCVRIPCAEIRLFATMLQQSSMQGNSLVPLLEQQAELRRQVIAAEIEEYAQEAPVRLLAPLALCILPATVIPFVVLIIVKVTQGF